MDSTHLLKQGVRYRVSRVRPRDLFLIENKSTVGIMDLYGKENGLSVLPDIARLVDNRLDKIGSGSGGKRTFIVTNSDLSACFRIAADPRPQPGAAGGT